MNPFIELMQAGALIMLLFAVVLIAVVIRNMPTRSLQVRWGPALIGVALVRFAIPVYASVAGTEDLGVLTPTFRVLGAVLLPFGLYLLGAFGQEGLGRGRRQRDPSGSPGETGEDEV